MVATTGFNYQQRLEEEASPAQLKKNDNHSSQKGTREGKCVAAPVLKRAQTKKSDKIHPLKVKEAMSSKCRQVYHRRSQEEGFHPEEML